MSGKNVVIISVVVGVLVIFSTAILVAFILQRRSRLQQFLREHSSSFKPGYNVDEGAIPADVRSSITEIKSPVTPTEFFSPGMFQVAGSGDKTLDTNVQTLYAWFHIFQEMVKKEKFMNLKVVHFCFVLVR